MQGQLSDRFEKALQVAFRLHREQTRKDSHVPYLAHLLAVCATVMEHTENEDLMIAALLHDAAEDQGGDATLDEIRKAFGDSVADLVKACSDTLSTPKPPWKPRKQAYLEKIARASDQVLLITLADKIHNARSIERDYRRLGDRVWDRFNGGKSGTLWYYQSLAEILEDSPYPVLSGEFTRLVASIQSLANF